MVQRNPGAPLLQLHCSYGGGTALPVLGIFTDTNLLCFIWAYSTPYYSDNGMMTHLKHGGGACGSLSATKEELDKVSVGLHSCTPSANYWTPAAVSLEPKPFTNIELKHIKLIVI